MIWAEFVKRCREIWSTPFGIVTSKPKEHMLLLFQTTHWKNLTEADVNIEDYILMCGTSTIIVFYKTLNNWKVGTASPYWSLHLGNSTRALVSIPRASAYRSNFALDRFCLNFVEVEIRVIRQISTLLAVVAIIFLAYELICLSLICCSSWNLVTQKRLLGKRAGKTFHRPSLLRWSFDMGFW